MTNPIACWLLVASCIAAPDAGGGSSPPSAESTKAELAYQRLVLPGDSLPRSRIWTINELKACGDAAFPFLIRGTKHDWDEVRTACYRLLFEKFRDHEQTAQAALRGLSDESSMVQSECADFAGGRRIVAAEPGLRKIYERSSGDLRLAAAKSLAELGHKDVIGVLYRGAMSEDLTQRRQANIGLKALSGRDLNGFGEYNWIEGAFGCTSARAPIRAAELRAERYQALAEYCRWLSDEWPDLYDVLDHDLQHPR